MSWSLNDVDWSKGAARDRLRLPERLTPLAHTAHLEALRDEERLRYNHLCADGVSEQFRVLELGVLNTLAATLVPDVESRLAARLCSFIEDEERHSALFGRLLIATRGSQRHQLVEISSGLSLALRLCQRRPGLFVAWPFLALALEEKTIAFYRALKTADEDTLCPLHVRAHQLHMLDEVGHLALDAEFIERVWRPASKSLKKINAALLTRVLARFVAPKKRGSVGANVCRQLVREFPRLNDRLPAMLDAIAVLDQSRAFKSQLFSRATLPKTARALAREPELSGALGLLA